MVVVFHLILQLDKMDFAAPESEWLSSGVDLFFVVSGFIMWWTTDNRDMTPMQFMQRRIHRIVPIYWAISSVYVAILLFLPALMQSGALDTRHVVASFFFLPYPHPVLGDIWPLVPPGWTLNYEMFFYVIFAISLALPQGSRLASLCAILVGLVAIGNVLDPASVAGQFYTSSLLLEFLYGVLIAVLVGRGTALPAGLALAVLALAFAMLPLRQGFATADTRALWYGVPSALIVAAAVSFERRRQLPRHPGLLLLGDASYSLYLSHPIGVSVSGQLWRRLFGASDWISASAFVMCGTLAATAVGLACYRWVEVPLGRVFKPLLMPQPRPT